VSTVLIVDDDERIREILRRWLNAAGYQTIEAGDAERGLEILNEGQSDVVLCDVNMPGRGGLWLVQRAAETHPAVAIVLATGIEAVHPSITLGGNVVDYLIKPFERAAVLTAVGLARAWHETASARSTAPDDPDALGKWLRGGRAHDAERK
jgi:DNA-binding NtrC family response regulator